ERNDLRFRRLLLDLRRRFVGQGGEGDGFERVGGNRDRGRDRDELTTVRGLTLRLLPGKLVLELVQVLAVRAREHHRHVGYRRIEIREKDLPSHYPPRIGERQRVAATEGALPLVAATRRESERHPVRGVCRLQSSRHTPCAVDTPSLHRLRGVVRDD